MSVQTNQSNISSRFGFNPNINVAASEDVWSYGGKRTSPTTTFTPYISSDSASDTDAIVTVVYLDADNVRQDINVNMNGLTPVSVGVTASEVTLSYEANSTPNALVGNVSIATANNFTGGVPDNQEEVLVHIPAGFGFSQEVASRVPAGQIYIIKGVLLLMARDKGAPGNALVTLDVRLSGGTWRSLVPFYMSTTSVAASPLFGLVLPEGTDYKLNVRSVSGDNTQISGVVMHDEIDVTSEG